MIETYSLTFITITLILYIVGGFLVYKAVLEYLGIREMKRQVTIPVSLIKDGIVEIRGWARPVTGIPLISPISHNPCIYYHVVVERKITTGKSTKWVTVHSKGDSLDLIISDDSGSVLVRPVGAEFRGAEEIQYTTDLFNKPGPALLSFLEREGIRHKGIFEILRETMRYTEYYVPPGGYMYILGHASYSPLSENEPEFRRTVPYVIRNGGRKRKFIISDRSERWIIERARRRVIGYSAGAIMLFLLPPILFAVLGSVL
ncbi:MAG: hypothetical protein ACMUIG_06140 [Thermoplasmatota archaeon]